MGSGSAVRRRQFTMFRVFWPPKRKPWSLMSKLPQYGLDVHAPLARQILGSSPEFAKYLAIVAAGFPLEGITEHDAAWAGAWMLVARYQASCVEEHSTNHETAAREEYEGKDEVLANTALLLFLETIEMMVSNRTATWTMERVRFQAEFGALAKFTALTDGALWSRLRRRVLGLVEVKRKRRRAPDEEQVQMQESAELVGWQINSEAADGICGNDNQRVMLSQDGDQVYVSFAKPDARYTEYLKVGLQEGTNPFMRVQTYGPFWLWDAGHMYDLAVVVLSIFLTANAAAQTTG